MKRFLTIAIALFSIAVAVATPADSNVGVGPQYDTTHVYVQPEDFDKFVASLLATFGGTTTKQGVFTVTPTAEQDDVATRADARGNRCQSLDSRRPCRIPFGAERTGYLVTDLDAAVRCSGGRRRRRSRDSVQRSDRQGRRDSVAGRREHAALLAHHPAFLPCAQNHSGKPRLRFGGPGARHSSRAFSRFLTARSFPTMRARRESRSAVGPRRTAGSGFHRSSA